MSHEEHRLSRSVYKFPIKYWKTIIKPNNTHLRRKHQPLLSKYEKSDFTHNCPLAEESVKGYHVHSSIIHCCLITTWQLQGTAFTYRACAGVRSSSSPSQEKGFIETIWLTGSPEASLHKRFRLRQNLMARTWRANYLWRWCLDWIFQAGCTARLSIKPGKYFSTEVSKHCS